ncbi:MAG: hypothetical protein R3B96_05045 [Pirellulaceae bacterium]
MSEGLKSSGRPEPSRPSVVSWLARLVGADRPTTRLSLGLVFVATIVSGAALCSLDRLPAYRDAGHYYEPLFRWQSMVLASGDGVLWDPHENLGRALDADPTAATFYPPALAMRLLPLPWPARMNGFLLVHLLLAACGAAWGARRLGAGRSGALVSAVAYVSAGAVVTQVNNIPFLVSAAWFPWALGAGWTAIVRPWRKARSPRHIALAMLAIGMLVLGGDPQGAVHVVIALALMLFCGRVRVAAKAASTTSRPSGPIEWLNRAVAGVWRLRREIALLVLIVGGAIALSAVQWYPSLQAARESERRVRREPRSLYEGIADSWRTDLGPPQSRVTHVSLGWFGTPLPGTHHDASLQYSLPPWQWGELLWPNFSGRGYPTQRRWIEGIPASDRSWFPSIYFGGLVLLLVGSSFLRSHRSARARATVRWLRVGFVLFALLSLGWYGPGWLVQELAQGLGFDDASQL